MLALDGRLKPHGTLQNARSVCSRPLTGSREVLVTGPSTEQDPEWSPGGQMVVFWSDRDGNAELYIATSDGSEVVRLTDDPGVDRNPTWSP